jgi:NADH-quinone oxidoreductase subunit N
MSLSDLLTNTVAILPVVIVITWASLLLVVDLFIPAGRKGLTVLLASLGLVVALVVTVLRLDQTNMAFNGMIMVDGFASFLFVLFLISGLLAIALSYDYLKRMKLERGEYYVLLLFSVSGMMLMAGAADLIVVFLALELLSIPLYVLAGFAVPRPDSEEAALKYFLLGSFSTGIFVYGTALIFGATGSTSIQGIVSAINSGSAGGFQVSSYLLLIGAALLLIGLGFKVALVPFHMWTPDVYQGAPTSVAAFMAVGAKTAGFAALLRVFVLAFPSLAVDLTPVMWVLAALTMLLGNLVAIAQSNIKRLLAYSSIAQAGYILMAMVPYGNSEVAADSVAAGLFFLAGYTFTSFTAWAVVIMLEQAEGRGLSIEDYAGLGRKYPLLGFAMTVAMLSFIGVPPTLGFVGKFYLFSTVIEGGFIGLALIGVLTSLISAYYYLRVVVLMYMRDGEPQPTRERWVYVTALATAVVTVVFSIFAAPLFNWASQAVLQLF